MVELHAYEGHTLITMCLRGAHVLLVSISYHFSSSSRSLSCRVFYFCPFCFSLFSVSGNMSIKKQLHFLLSAAARKGTAAKAKESLSAAQLEIQKMLRTTNSSVSELHMC